MIYVDPTAWRMSVRTLLWMIGGALIIMALFGLFFLRSLVWPFGIFIFGLGIAAGVLGTLAPEEM